MTARGYDCTVNRLIRGEIRTVLFSKSVVLA